MHVKVNRYLGFSILKVLKIAKKCQQKISFKKILRKIRVKKNGINVKEPYQVYTCIKFQVDVLKNAMSFGVLKIENGHCHAIFGNFDIFSDFQNLSHLGSLRSFPRVLFRVLDEK